MKRTKLISTSSPLYAQRMATQINRLQLEAPYFKMEGNKFNNRRIIKAWTENGVLMGRSLNGEFFPVNVECVWDINGKHVCASREA